MKKVGLVLVLLVSLAFAKTLTFHGIEASLNSNGLKIGAKRIEYKLLLLFLH